MMDIPSNHILRLANDGNLVRVSTIALVIRANAHVLKPPGVDERLDLSMVRFNAKFAFHNYLCWWTQVPILWGHLLLILYQLR
jgi:hypothetical protein